MKIVAIGSHPDDIEIGVGGTLAKHAALGDTTYAILCTLGGVSGDPIERKKEAQMAARLLGIKKLWILDYPVEKLNKSTIELTKILKRIIEKVDPTRVYTHGPFDYHQVHVAVNESVVKATNDINQVLFYETISSTTYDFKPNAYVDITKYINIKIKSVEKHKSQLISRFYLQPNVIRSHANTRYVWGKVGTNPHGMAEAFRIHKFIL